MRPEARPQDRPLHQELSCSTPRVRTATARTWLVLGAVAISLCACGSSPQVGTPEQAVEDILADLAEARWAAVFELLDDPVRGECASPDRLGAWIESRDARPQSWKVFSTSIRKTRALVSGEVVSKSGKTTSFGFGLSRTETGWRPSTWSMRNREVCLEDG